MNLIWDQLIQKQILLAQESNQTFFHVNSFEEYKELEKLKFIISSSILYLYSVSTVSINFCFSSTENGEIIDKVLIN